MEREIKTSWDKQVQTPVKWTFKAAKLAFRKVFVELKKYLWGGLN